jgi:hypothetical protein
MASMTSNSTTNYADPLTTLVGFVTRHPLSNEDSAKMTEAIIQIRELMNFAKKIKAKQEERARNEMMTPPWNR